MSCSASFSFAILLPVTSRGLSLDQVRALVHRFTTSLIDTTKAEREKLGVRTRIYVGIDADDRLAEPAQADFFGNIFNEHGMDWRLVIFGYPSGSVCKIWRDLGKRAYLDGFDYQVLLGDDVTLKTNGWMTNIHKAFCSIAEERGLPHGFGCVTFFDQSFRGFPTFPVIHRTHYEAHEGELFGAAFQNQHADPFLFHLYRRFNASVYLGGGEATLTNEIGGPREARYVKDDGGVYLPELLAESVIKLEAFLDTHCGAGTGVTKRVVTLDIGVPSFRVQPEVLAPIFALLDSSPPGLNANLVLVCDNPAAQKELEILKERYEHDSRVKIRANGHNIGASRTRNHILQECLSEWVLFLDDDVVPSPAILDGCLEAILTRGQAPDVVGFIGSTSFPKPVTAFSGGTLLSGCAFFFAAASRWDLDKEMPWGVTANLLVRHDDRGVKFDDVFPKTGGGEDIDYCFKKVEGPAVSVRMGGRVKGRFLPAPSIAAQHPWWRDGDMDLRRFFMWAWGDGILLRRYPWNTYTDIFPNAVEIGALLLCVVVVSLALSLGLGLTSLLLGGTSLKKAAALCAQVVILTLYGLPSLLVGELLHDLVRFLWLERDAFSAVNPFMYRAHACLFATLIRLASESGRLHRSLLQGTVMKRFDWYRGTWIPAIQAEKRMRKERFMLCLTIYVCVLAVLFS